jgi:DNA helicase-2/ATP-dependent DNA helicase PcrA
LAYLRLLENPRDDTSFMRVVNFPPRGIGARSIEQLQDAARASGCALHDAVSSIGGKAGANISAFVAKLDVLREQTHGQTLRQIIELVLDHSQLIEHYQAEREGADRVENLQELVNAAESFVTQEGFGKDAVALPVDEALQSQADFAAAQAKANGTDLQADADTGETLSPLAAFLSHAALEAGDNQAQAGEDAVQLMTVHASKGLEFDAVFITGKHLMRGKFNFATTTTI